MTKKTQITKLKNIRENFRPSNSPNKKDMIMQKMKKRYCRYILPKIENKDVATVLNNIMKNFFLLENESNSEIFRKSVVKKYALNKLLTTVNITVMFFSFSLKQRSFLYFCSFSKNSIVNYT